MQKLSLIIPIAATILFAGCQKKFDDIEYTQGDADFTKFISVGNSLTQGYMNGGVYEGKLYQEGQRCSFPSILARQMSKVNTNMGEFVQPYFKGNGSGYLHLAYENDKIQVVQEHDKGGYEEDPGFSSQTYIGTNFNNYGVSGIKLIGITGDDDIPGDNQMYYVLAASNPYHTKMFKIGTQNNPLYYLDDLRAKEHTFFTCWLGNNDLLGYATEGGQPFPLGFEGTTFYAYGLSEPAEFKKKYNLALDALTKNGAKGVVATLPKVTTIPYFNIIDITEFKGTDGLPLDVYIETNTGVRKATTRDVILLPAASKLNKFEKDSIDGGVINDENGDPYQVYSSTPYGFGKDNPIINKEVLDEIEFAPIVPRMNELNQIIRDAAAAHNLPVADMAEFLTNFESGITINGEDFTADYITGGVFSLDGVHPNARGYAIIANKFIETINEHYGSNIPSVSINKYRGIIFPK